MLRKAYHAVMLFCVVFLGIASIGCSTNSADDTDPNKYYGNSAITRMPVSRYLAENRRLINSLTAGGVQFIQTGDDLMLVLSSDQFFVDNTPVLSAGSYSALNDLASLLKGHEKFSVKIAGYTDRMGWQPRNMALSREQAETVAQYLWKQGVDTRLIYTTGYGARQFIANNITDNGRAMNRRIEITLRWVTDPKQG